MPGNPDVILIFLSSRERFIDKLKRPPKQFGGRFFAPGAGSSRAAPAGAKLPPPGGGWGFFALLGGKGGPRPFSARPFPL